MGCWGVSHGTSVRNHTRPTQRGPNLPNSAPLQGVNVRHILPGSQWFKAPFKWNGTGKYSMIFFIFFWYRWLISADVLCKTCSRINMYIVIASIWCILYIYSVWWFSNECRSYKSCIRSKVQLMQKSLVFSHDWPRNGTCYECCCFSLFSGCFLKCPLNPSPPKKKNKNKLESRTS